MTELSEVPEQFFEGTTHAGRVLRLFFEHTAYDTFTDDMGQTFDNPTETKCMGTLDGAPITIERYNIRWRESVTVVTNQGTFTAIATDYAEDHSEALRRYLERRPSAGWEVAIVDKAQDGDESCYTVSITNGRLTDHAEFRLSPQVANTLARDAHMPTEEAVTREISHTVRSDEWVDIQRRAGEPTTLLWLLHPS